MPIDLDAKLVETASKVVTTRNEYGDTVFGTTSSVPCLYRDISSLGQAANREEITLDGILWFGASENAVKGDIYYHTSEGYLRIQRVIKAKTLVSDDSLKFVKCEVTKQRQIS